MRPVMTKSTILFRVTSLIFTVFLFVLLVPATIHAASDELKTILPDASQFSLPAFKNYEVNYSSAMGKDAFFTLLAIKSLNGKKLVLIDIIPMKDNVIVAQRHIDMKTQHQEFSASPYFAWGSEFVVAQNTADNYDWNRVPIGGGEAARAQGELANGGGVDVMFSPTLAALMPMDVGSRFELPQIYPRKGGLVSSEMDQYQMLRKEQLELASGVSCECWVIERKSWSGSTTQYWVSREAPFIYRRHRDVGGPRDFVSDVLAFRLLD